MTVQTANIPVDKSSFRAKASLLHQAFETLEKEWDKVRTYFDNSQLLQAEFDNHRSLIQSLAHPYFPVCFGGVFSRGKSTLVNALFSDQAFLPKGNIATTAFPTYIFKAKEGEEEKAEIFYLNEAEREELKKDYLEHLVSSLSLHQDNSLLEKLLNLSANGLKAELDKIVEQGKMDGKAISKSYECLKKLLNNWDEKVGSQKSGSIKEALKIQEKDSNSIIIKEVKVYLKHLPYDESIVLIDLPGVGADNIRHEKITASFSLGDKAKAFVFVYDPKTLDDNSISSLVRRINNEKQSVNNAFWIINMWDEESERQELETYFKEKLKAANIQLRDDRLFKIPLVKEEELSQAEGSFQQSTKELKEALINYLQEDAFEEYLRNAKSVYYRIKRKFILALEGIDIPEHDDSLKAQFVFKKANQAYRKWENQSKETLELALKNLKSALMEDQFQFLREEEVKLIANVLSEMLSNLSVKDIILTSSLAEKNDPDPDWGDIIQKLVHSVNAGELVREAIKDRLADKILDDINAAFTFVAEAPLISSNLNISLPDQVAQKMELILNTANFHHRLEGICDAVVSDYTHFRQLFQHTFFSDPELVWQKTLLYRIEGDQLDYSDANIDFQALANQAATANPELFESLRWEDRVKFAIHYLGKQVIKYIREKREATNQLVKFSLENHYIDVKTALCQFFENERVENLIRNAICKALYEAPLDDAIALEHQRIIALRSFRALLDH